MFWSRRNLVLTACVVGVAAVGVWFMIRAQRPSDPLLALDQADQYELYSILPGPQPGAPKEEFHGYPVLGKVSITDRAARERLTNVLKAGVVAGHGGNCFVPRHAIRTVKGATVTDFVICFECQHVHIWRNGEPGVGLKVAPTPEPVFDEMLKGAGIPLAPKAAEHR